VKEKQDNNNHYNFCKTAKLCRYGMVGRLFPGIVHNINSPLQIITMQMELFRLQFEGAATTDTDKTSAKFMSDSLKRLERMEMAIKHISMILDNVSLRFLKPDDIKLSVFPVSILEEEIEFHKSDMFFKHKTKITHEPNGEKFCITTNPLFIRDMFCAMFSVCIEQLKKESGPASIRITYQHEQNNHKIRFEISGTFPESLSEIKPAGTEPLYPEDIGNF
jgi:hypothetical protein